MTDLFRTRDHVANFDDYVRLYAERSAATRARLRARLDIAYGPGADEKLDLFYPEELESRAPIHLFVHGGYWRMFGKSDFSFIADSVSSTGAITAVMDYSLMPVVRMNTIVDQVHRAYKFLVETAPSLGGDSNRISVSGHSAGAHLCALLLDSTNKLPPPRALLLSGIYDLSPLQTSFLQPELNFTPDEVKGFSPLNRDLDAGGDVHILVGETETTPFHSQAADLAQRIGTKVTTLASENHMSAALALGNPNSQAGRALVSICS